MGEGPESLSDGLNAQQAAAVRLDHAVSGPVLVLAGAGSGKTTVLARRIARQALLDGTGEGILALTFTKEAAEEMAARVDSLLRVGDAAFPSRGRPLFGTFHAFAYGLLRVRVAGMHNWRRLGFVRCPSVLDPAERDAWLAGLRRDGIWEGTQEEAERLLAKPFEGDPAEESGPAGKLRPLWRSHLLERGALAFDDMVALAIRLLRDFPEALAEVRGRIRRVLVDEFQDTSPDQLDLVRLVIGDRPDLFLVGDDDQAIYGFRGADPGNIAKALEMFPGMGLLKLETNYRSTPPIVAYANGVFRDKPARLRKTLQAGRALPLGARPSPVAVRVHATGAEQGAWMAAEMRRLAEAEGLGWGGIAVLYRLNALEPYYRSLVSTLAGPEAAAAMTFATVHASKGLQYPAVFLVGLEDGLLPYRRRGEAADPARLAEERRIFYVGVTRAERFLYLCACRRRVMRGRPRELRASPFLRGEAGSWSGIARKVGQWLGRGKDSR